jgi:hypothetical protein
MRPYLSRLRGSPLLGVEARRYSRALSTPKGQRRPQKALPSSVVEAVRAAKIQGLMRLKVQRIGQMWQRRKGMVKGQAVRPPMGLREKPPKAMIGPKRESEANFTAEKRPLILPPSGFTTNSLPIVAVRRAA